MNRTFSAALAFTWRPENDGQPYHVDPNDPGGGTAWAVTVATWAAACEHGYVRGDLRSASRDHCALVLRQMYWNAIRGEMLPSGADILVFDVAVVDGPGRAARFLQRTVGADEDGIIGPQTLRLAAMTEAGILLAKLTTVDDDFLQGLATYRYFGRGLERRLNDCVQYAAGFLAHQFPVGISASRISTLSGHS